MNPINNAWLQRLHFALAGSLGFLSEFISLYILTNIASLGVAVSKPVAYLLATGVTWFYNSRITFTDASVERRYSQASAYFFAAATAAAFNHLVFFIAVYQFELEMFFFALPLVLSSSMTMFYSYFVYKYLVFGK